MGTRKLRLSNSAIVRRGTLVTLVDHVLKDTLRISPGEATPSSEYLLSILMLQDLSSRLVKFMFSTLDENLVSCLHFAIRKIQALKLALPFSWFYQHLIVNRKIPLTILRLVFCI